VQEEKGQCVLNGLNVCRQCKGGICAVPKGGVGSLCRPWIGLAWLGSLLMSDIAG